MIQPLQSNLINFKGADASPALKARIESQANQQQGELAVQEEPKKKFSIKETYTNTKKKVINFFKGVNNVTGVTAGVARGIAEGAVTTVAVASVAKAVREAKDSQGLKVLLDIPTAIGKDAWSALKGVGSWAGRLVTEEKALYKHFGEILSLPKKFYTTYLKGNKAVGAIATAVGIGVLVARAVQGKVSANEKNADLDHKTNSGHV